MIQILNENLSRLRKKKTRVEIVKRLIWAQSIFDSAQISFVTISSLLRYMYVTVNLSNSIGLIHSGKNTVNIRNSRVVWVLFFIRKTQILTWLKINLSLFWWKKSGFLDSRLGVPWDEQNQSVYRNWSSGYFYLRIEFKLFFHGEQIHTS